MILRPVAKVKLLFERLGFSLDNERTSTDGEGRDILWATLVFCLSEARSRAIDRVESIINADRKVGLGPGGAGSRMLGACRVATCKLALIRALCHIATTSWASRMWQAAWPFWPLSYGGQHGHGEGIGLKTRSPTDSIKLMDSRTEELVFDVLQEQDGGFTAECLSESIITQANTWQDLRNNATESVSAYFFDGAPPVRIRLHLVRDEVFTLA